MKKNKTKRILAGVLSVLIVAGFTVPANVGTGGLFGNTEIVAKADYYCPSCGSQLIQYPDCPEEWYCRSCDTNWHEHELGGNSFNPTINTTSITLEVGQTYQLSVEGGDVDFFYSYNESVATVGDYSGKITAVGVGTADISAYVSDPSFTSDSIYLYCHVTVVAPPTVTSPPTAKTLTYTEQAQELVNPGTASDGSTMKYAISTKKVYKGNSINLSDADIAVGNAFVPTGYGGIYFPSEYTKFSLNGQTYSSDYVNIFSNGRNLYFLSDEGNIKIGDGYDGVRLTGIDGDTLTFEPIKSSEYDPTKYETWSDSIPTATDIGTYKVLYKAVRGDQESAVGGVSVSIEEPPTVTTPPTAKTLTYTGQALALVNEGTASNGSTMKYALSPKVYKGNNINLSDADIAVGNAFVPTGYTGIDFPSRYTKFSWNGQTYSFDYISIFIDDGKLCFLLEEEDIEVGDGYDGVRLTAINGNTLTFEPIKFSEYDPTKYATWSDSIPTATDIGTYTVFYKAVKNGIESAVGGVSVSIEAPPTVTKKPTAKTLTYTGQAQALVNAGTASNGSTMKYAVSDFKARTYGGNPSSVVINGSASVVIDKDNPEETLEWSDTIPTGTDAGTYKVLYKAVRGDKESEVGEVSVDIAGATPTVTAPTPKTLGYTGQAQALVNAGSASGGTLQYKLNNGSWGTSIPTATNAGSYTVYYKVVGDSNHNDNNGGNIPVTINKKTVTAPVIKLPSGTDFDYTYDGTAKTPTVILKDNNDNTIPESEYTVKYENNTNAGTATVKITNKDGGNYQIYDSSMDFTINTADYTAKVTLNDLTYGESSENAKPVVSGLPKEVQDANPEITYEYKAKGTNNWSSNVPVEEGEYTIRATIAQTANYNSQTATSDFTIKLKEGFVHIQPTAPTKEGKLFAGYFTDSTCTKPYTGTDGVAYAKFVDADKWLKVAEPVFSSNGSKGTLQISALVPDSSFKEIRFEIQIGNTVKKVKADKLFKAESGCKAVYTLNNITKKYFGKEITITPTWKTLDGTTVTGTSTTYTIPKQ